MNWHDCRFCGHRSPARLKRLHQFCEEAYRKAQKDLFNVKEKEQ